MQMARQLIQSGQATPEQAEVAAYGEQISAEKVKFDAYAAQG